MADKIHANSLTGYLEGWKDINGDESLMLPKVYVAAQASSGPVTVTLVDNSIASATGASQTLLAANTARKALTIINPSWETTDWTIGPTGATAVAGAVPGIKLAPGDEWTPTKVPLNAITGIGTSTHKLTVLEG